MPVKKLFPITHINHAKMIFREQGEKTLKSGQQINFKKIDSDNKIYFPFKVYGTIEHTGMCMTCTGV